MSTEFELRVAILKDKEAKLNEYNKMIQETEITYQRVCQSNKLYYRSLTHPISWL